MSGPVPRPGEAAASSGRDLAALGGGLLLALLFALACVALVSAYAPSLAETTPAFVEAGFTLLLYGGFILIGLVGGRLTRIDALRMGGAGSLAGGGVGCLAGTGALIVALAGSLLAGALGPGDGEAAAAIVWLPLGAAAVTVQVAGEEVLFRGWLQPLAIRLYGARIGIAGIAIAFALLHFAGAWLGIVALVNLALGGLLFGLLAWRTGGLAAPIAAHLAWNGMEALLFGLTPNPGIGSFGSLLDLDLTGSALAGGGPAGLNESLQMTAALLIANGGVLLWMRLSPAPPRAAR